MLTFVMSDDHQYTIRDILETRPSPLAGHVIILPHREFLSRPRLPVADYVFVDLERLSAPRLEAVTERFEKLQAALPEIRVLNAPGLHLKRIAVMQNLHHAGINRFRVQPASAPREALRFPVFVRRLDDHEGPMSALLQDQAAVDAAIAEALGAGMPPDLLAVTEYVDARNEDGHHEKLSYFRIGDRLFPSALDASRNWVCKGVIGDPDTVDVSDRERTFLETNPHAEALMPAFEAAGIGYGRADYAVIDGVPQIFEINTNPLVDQPEQMPAHLRPYALRLVERWLGGLAAFSPPAPGDARWIAVAGGRAAEAPPPGHRIRRAVRAGLDGMGRLHQETRVMQGLRAAGLAR